MPSTTLDGLPLFFLSLPLICPPLRQGSDRKKVQKNTKERDHIIFGGAFLLYSRQNGEDR